MTENFIRKFRKEKGTNQRALAGLVGISQQHLQRLETGASPVRMETASAICAALDLPPANVFPAIAEIISRTKPGATFEKVLSSADFRAKLVVAGVETGVELRHEAHFVISGGSKHVYPLSAGDANRLNEAPATPLTEPRSPNRFCIWLT